MANISPWQYNVTIAGTTNTNQIPIYGGTITVTPEYYAPTCARKSLSWQGSDMDVIDALFALKPRLKKKYKTRERLRKALLAAAKLKQGQLALEGLSDVLR